MSYKGKFHFDTESFGTVCDKIQPLERRYEDLQESFQYLGDVGTSLAVQQMIVDTENLMIKASELLETLYYLRANHTELDGKKKPVKAKVRFKVDWYNC